LAVLAADNVAVASRSLTVNGVPLSLDASGATTFTPTAPGLYTLVGTATDPSGNRVTATATVRVFDPTDVTSPTAEMTSPIYGDTVTYLTPITGTVTDDNLEFYTLEYAVAGSNQWTAFAQGTSNVVNGTLGTFDPTLLANGPYDLRLTTQDIDGHLTY